MSKALEELGLVAKYLSLFFHLVLSYTLPFFFLNVTVRFVVITESKTFIF